MQCSSFFVVLCGHPEVIHVLPCIVLVPFQEGGEVTPHHSLKEGRRIAQAKVHYCGDVGACLCLYGCLVLVLLLYANVAVAPSYVKLQEEVAAVQCFHGLPYARDGVVVLHCDCIDSSVVHDNALFVAVLLVNMKDRRDDGGGALLKPSQCHLFLNPFVLDPCLFLRSRIRSTFDRGRCIWQELNGHVWVPCWWVTLREFFGKDFPVPLELWGDCFHREVSFAHLLNAVPLLGQVGASQECLQCIGHLPCPCHRLFCSLKEALEVFIPGTLQRHCAML